MLLICHTHKLLNAVCNNLNVCRYVARVYCLEGRGLTGKDLDGKSDPYVRVKVGDGTEVTARESYCEGTLNPDLFVRLADVPIQIPGPATMEVQGSFVH